ncbi:hypothetical protein [Bradyrhizobium sp. Gha]|uniref:hypothetical protein n=1 Tax=Bradyrhizobium sp. Gha TaxID=1855318 RepID=UPI0015A6DBB6|nr:hypothetical protein [Bradyrhizobium sp. Gha]
MTDGFTMLDRGVLLSLYLADDGGNVVRRDDRRRPETRRDPRCAFHGFGCLIMFSQAEYFGHACELEMVEL